MGTLPVSDFAATGKHQSTIPLVALPRRATDSKGDDALTWLPTLKLARVPGRHFQLSERINDRHAQVRAWGMRAQ
jgi:hypothetical protein